MSHRKNIERQRMEFAFEQSKNACDQKKYEAYVQKVPAFILTNGLGNTIAFISTQSNCNWIKVGNNIFDWLEVDNPAINESSALSGDKKIKKLLKVIKDMEDPEYRSLTIEILALFNWLRRFAKAHKIS